MINSATTANPTLPEDPLQSWSSPLLKAAQKSSAFRGWESQNHRITAW